MRYLQENETIGWAYWAFNGYKTTPDSDETFGIMNADMKTVRYDWRLADLQTIQAQPKITNFLN